LLYTWERIKSFRSICDHAAFDSSRSRSLSVRFVLYVCVFALSLWFMAAVNVGAEWKTLFSRKFVIQSPLAWISISCAVKKKTSGAGAGAGEREMKSRASRDRAESKEHEQGKFPRCTRARFCRVLIWRYISLGSMKNLWFMGSFAFLHLWTWSHSRYGFLVWSQWSRQHRNNSVFPCMIFEAIWSFNFKSQKIPTLECVKLS